MSLEFPESKATASRYVREAIPLMVKNNIAPNPCNFALWYTYVSNRDFDLNTSLDNAIATQGTCPPPVSQELFKKHVIGEEIEQQIGLQESFTDVVKGLLNDVANTCSGTNALSQNLEQNLDIMLNDSDPEHIQSAVKDMITATQDTSNIISGFQSQLQSAELEINALKTQLLETEKDAHIDALTQIGNRRAFDQRIYELCENEHKNTTLVLIDLDHFKNFNDTYGHLLGDKVLQGVSAILKKICPDNVLAARYGGEEFAFLVEGDLSSAYELAETTRKLFKNLSLRKKNSSQVIDNITASFGVAQQRPGEFPEQLIERADKALYSAKENGRNQVTKAA